MQQKQIYTSMTESISPTVKMIIDELQALSNAEKREVFPRFFKAGKGEYGEGDLFLGVTVPNIRTIAKQHKDISLDVIRELMLSKWHEVRLCALLIMDDPSQGLGGVRLLFTCPQHAKGCTTNHG